MAEAYKRNTCRLCGGRKLDQVLELTPTPPADSYIPVQRLEEVQEVYPINLFLCRDCGGAQLGDIIDVDEVYLNYIYETVSSLGLVKHFKKFADDVMEQFKPAPEGLVIDIGSNDGTLLKFFRDRGMKVLGIDPIPMLAKKATEESGVLTLPKFFTEKYARELKKEYGTAAIITCNNLVANIDNLVDMIKGVRELMTSDTVFIFESFYLGDQVQNLVWDFTYHEHFSYFTVKPLKAFFNRLGMELFEVQRIPTKGGSIRFKIQLKGGSRQVSSTVDDLIKHEERIGIHNTDVFKEYVRRIETGKRELTELLSDLKAKGNTFAGFGASASSTTLIYHYGLGEKIDFIADDFTAKQNLFSPGFHIPVYHPDEIYKKKPNYIIILAWRYYEPIIKKHKRYLDEGGHFIVPLPTLKVI